MLFNTIVEDLIIENGKVKGVKTKEYIAKKKVFEDKFNIKIKEI